jgi:nicotinate-nucleotide--dimethylbenzimidazole phosphoribosyltransferase
VTNLADLATDVEWPDHDASTKAHDSLLHRPVLGELGSLVEWTCSVQGQFPPKRISRARLVIFVADHAVAAAGVSRSLPGATDDTITQIESGAAGVSALGELVGASGRVVRLDGPIGRIDVEDGLTADQVAEAIRLGAGIADEEIDSGADLLVTGNLGIGSTTAASALISVLTSAEPVKVTGRGGSLIDDDTWMRKVTAIRDARRRGWPYRSDPQQLLGVIGGPDVAALAGFLLRAAGRRTPVLLDGVVVSAAAVIAAAEQPRATRWWLAAHRTAEPAQALALARLDLTPVLDLGMAVGDGSGGLLALGLLHAALASTSDDRSRSVQKIEPIAPPKIGLPTKAAPRAKAAPRKTASPAKAASPVKATPAKAAVAAKSTPPAKAAPRKAAARAKAAPPAETASAVDPTVPVETTVPLQTG